MVMTIFFNILFMLSKEKTFMTCRMQILLQYYLQRENRVVNKPNYL